MSFENKKTDITETLKLIRRGIRENNISPYYFLYGNEDYFIDEIYNSLKKVFDDQTGLNFKLYTEENFNIAEATKYILTLPLMNDKKLVIFKDIAFFRTSDKKNENLRNDFVKALKDSREQNIVVILDHNSRDKDSKYEKYYDKSNAIASFIADNGIIVNLHKLDEVTLNKYIVKRFEKSNKIIDKVEAAYIIKNVGNNLKNIYNECDKIISSMGDKSKVERIDIDSIITKSIDDDVFDIINFANNNRLDEAIALYSDLKTTDKKPYDIFAVFASNYKNLLVAKDYIERGNSQNEIAKLMGIPTWMANKLVVANKYISRETLIAKIDRFTDLSFSRMNGNIDDDTLIELLLLK